MNIGDDVSNLKETTVEINKGLLFDVHNALVDAKENSQELLQTHEAALGRATRKNERIAKMYEDEIRTQEVLIHRIIKAINKQP